jgi:hypothetical protein
MTESIAQYLIIAASINIVLSFLILAVTMRRDLQ